MQICTVLPITGYFGKTDNKTESTKCQHLKMVKLLTVYQFEYPLACMLVALGLRAKLVLPSTCDDFTISPMYANQFYTSELRPPKCIVYADM